ncbi:hypothetical protein [Moraxella catarrhalis]|nr:hypothetical protein [Moraxella catarrhalis]OAV33275.1 hypothetical protein AO368_0180 [Moraxella catarrhalis]
MTKVRKCHNAEFKSKVAVEAIKEQKTIMSVCISRLITIPLHRFI